MRLDKKVNSWSGSIEVGVTSTDPDHLSREEPFPSSANELRSGNSIIPQTIKKGIFIFS